MNSRQAADRIAGIIHNRPLAKAIDRSIRVGLDHEHVRLTARSAWDVFNASLNAAIRDIETHPRGKLFRRLLEYGPPNPDGPQQLTSDGETVLSDPKCGQRVQFIFSLMINRFKGELAELLAIAPCLELVQILQRNNLLSPAAEMYFGETIQERRRVRSGNRQQWSGFAKGADGLVVEKHPDSRTRIKIRGVIEVKCMSLPQKKILGQIRHHLLA